MDENIARLLTDVTMISERALPDFEKDFAAADEKMALCRAAVSPENLLLRLRQEL